MVILHKEMARCRFLRTNSRRGPSCRRIYHDIFESVKWWRPILVFTNEKYPCGRLLTRVHNKCYKYYDRITRVVLYRPHKFFSRAETIDSECEGGCLAWLSRFVKNPLSWPKLVNEWLWVGCEFPSSQAFRNDYRLNFHKLFSRAETIDSECEGGCLAWLSRFVKNPLSWPKLVFEWLWVGCEFPSSQAFRNDYRLNFHKLFSRAETIDSECEGGCLAWLSRFVKNPLSWPKLVFEWLWVGCEFPSSQAFRNDYRLNPLKDRRVHITDDSTSDGSEDHDVNLHPSKQSTTGDIDDTCHLHSPVPCTPADVIMVGTLATPPRNWTEESGTCEEKHVENRVKNHEGNLSPQSSDRDTLRIKSGKEDSYFESLPEELQIHILKGLGYEKLFQMKVVSGNLRILIESNTFRHSISKSSSLSLLYLYIRDGEFQLSGFDLVLKKWRQLPTLRCLPPPGQNLFKEYLLSSAGGLVCANISKSLECERIVVCNPMTQTSTELPPLNFPRNPVLLHILVNPNANSYLVIAAGSSGMAEGHLSRKTEVFNSLTSKWEVTGDIPGCEFGLNEYQTGVCVDGVLYCVAFLEDGSAKGLLAYDVQQGKWLSDWRISLPCPEYANSFSIAQVVECDSQVYLFSEREIGHTVEHRIDKLDSTDRASGVGRWTNVVRENKTGGRGLLIYPEYACVGFGVGKLCIFSTLEHTGKVYDVRHGGPPEPLPPPQNKGVEVLHSLNPLAFTFEPNFKSLVEVCEKPV